MKTILIAVATTAALAAGCAVSADSSATKTEPVTTYCQPSACGPQLGLPDVKCWDGSTAGPTGNCVSTTSDPVCHWEIIECPPQPCTSTQCGPEPMIELDCHGVIEKPVCEAVNGQCGWRLPQCAPSIIPTTLSPATVNLRRN